MKPIPLETVALPATSARLRIDLSQTSRRRICPVSASPSIPLQTEDGLEPITLIWTGYAPAWWVAANLNGWSDTAYFSSAKTVNGAGYNYTLEQPDPGATPCIGPRNHVRIWDMGYSPVYGRWSIGSAHHEYTVCFPCHHVIDSWERAESDARFTFSHGQFTTSISNFTLANAGNYQGIYNDGNATLIQLKPPPNEHPVVFNENGMSNGTSWSATLDGTTMSSQLPDIIFTKPNGTYSFTIVPPSGYNATPSSGTITVTGTGATETILFRVPWTTSTTILHPKPGTPVPIGISGNATVVAQTIRFTNVDRPVLSFNVTEIGTRGVLNVTIPRSAAPPQSSVTVLVDGIQNGGTKVQQDAGTYYVYFVVPYGTHSVELQFTTPQPPYLVYIAIGAVSAGMTGLLFLVRDWRKRKLAWDRLNHPVPGIMFLRKMPWTNQVGRISPFQALIANLGPPPRLSQNLFGIVAIFPIPSQPRLRPESCDSPRISFRQEMVFGK